MKKKFLALVLTLSMVLSLVPMTALATEGDSTEQPLMTAEGQPASEGANGGSQDSNSNADGGSNPTGGEDSTNTNTGNNGNTGSEPGSTGGTEPGGSSTPGTGTGAEGGNTGTGGSTEGGGTEGGGEIPSTPEASTDAAKIGATKYETIAKAIEAAESSNNTITLLRDVKENITINKPLTLDLAGFTLTGADEKSAVVTITGSDETKPAITIKSSKLEEEKPVNGKITGGKKSGICITNADVTLSNLTVTKNASTGSGGGINAVRGEKLVVEQCEINENTAKNKGGGIHVEDTPLKVIDSEIKNNQGFHGAGINLSDTKKPVCGRHEITGTLIEGNRVFNDYGIGGGIYIGTTSEITIKDSTIKDNTADQGGGIGAYTPASTILDNVSIVGNHATVGAGILALTEYACDTELKLQNNTEVKDNIATYYGGGMMAWNDCDAGKKQVVTVENSSICNNSAKDGAGIFINFEEYAKNAFVTINLGTGAVVQGNTATRNGGGIFARNLGDTAVSKGTINVAKDSALYNNTAKDAGDDLYLKDNTTFTLPKASEMSGDKQFKISDEENGTVTGWFYDGWHKWDPNAKPAVKEDETEVKTSALAEEGETKGAYVEVARWSMDTADEYTPVNEDTKDVALKAATKKAPSPGGSGGGHRPSNPPVTIPDDVPTGLNGKDHYAYVVGYPDGMVYPQKNITRAEVATIFFRLLKDETREANMTKSNGYNDMKDGAWYTCAVSTLSKMGIIKGYEDGSFKPDAPISRAEFAAIAARFDPDGDKTPATFSDVSSHWAKDEISIAANHGWIKGYEDGSFKPDQKITRAETMTLVNRVLKRLPETKDDLHKDMKTWPDNQNESAWFYLAVQEATNSHYQNLKKDGTHEKWESMRETRDWAALEK